MLMHQRIFGGFLLALYFLLNYNGVQGEIKLSELEDLEIERQFKLLNKPAVKTIKTIYGDIYDCVDFYKQPAFDHPLLKNHNFHPEMKPTLARTKQNVSNWSTRRRLKDKGCPLGTVPLKRITKDDLIRQRNMPPPEDVTFNAKLTANNNNSELKGTYIASQGYKVAIVRTENNPDNKFAGAGMVTSIWNPSVKGQQHSACRLKIQKGSDIIQVGWRADPTLYGDSKTRRFIHFQAGDKHCFNTLCPGFVLVNTEIYLDKLYQHVTRRGATISWEDTMFISRDQVNGNWWLLLKPTHIEIGFWPEWIFTDLAGFATNVEWGGVVYSPPGVPEPPMGSSYFPIKNENYDAYCRGLQLLTVQGKTTDVDNTITHVDDVNLYKIIDVPHARRGTFQHFVFYGGPGQLA